MWKEVKGMSSKKKGAPTRGAVWHQSALEATLAKKPHFNAHICATGPQGPTKYDRAREKRAWQQELRKEWARTRGPIPFVTPMNCRYESAQATA